MAVIYARRIMEGLMTMDDVPALWRDQVRAIVQDLGEP